MFSPLSLIQKALTAALLTMALSSILAQAGELPMSATPMAAVHCELKSNAPAKNPTYSHTPKNGSHGVVKAN